VARCAISKVAAGETHRGRKQPLKATFQWLHSEIMALFCCPFKLGQFLIDFHSRQHTKYSLEIQLERQFDVVIHNFCTFEIALIVFFITPWQEKLK
jgi:glycopeptide antibiotics resistance protein